MIPLILRFSKVPTCRSLGIVKICLDQIVGKQKCLEFLLRLDEFDFLTEIG